MPSKKTVHSKDEPPKKEEAKVKPAKKGGAKAVPTAMPKAEKPKKSAPVKADQKVLKSAVAPAAKKTPAAKKAIAPVVPEKKAPARKATPARTSPATTGKAKPVKSLPARVAKAVKSAPVVVVPVPQTEMRRSAPPAGKTAHDYAEAKRALGMLWEDITRQTYSTFDVIARRIEQRFNEARKNVSEVDVKYALDKTGAKLKSVMQTGSESVQRMVKQAQLLYAMLKDAMAGKFKVPWVTISAATAALLYFISPIDVIPDFIPGIGFLDDALVVSLAISLARVDLKRYAKENDLNPADYGL